MDQIIIYHPDTNTPKVSVKLEGETVWLTQKQLAELFSTSRANITMHIHNIFKEGELTSDSVCKDFLLTANDNKQYRVSHYNLDVIIALGYRINSKIATQFRIWATHILKEYLVKGFAMDDDRLKGTGGGDYWRELFDRIRDIRSSEKALYRQILDLYATSIDYDSHSKETIMFFKIVQNKLHYATNLQTASEVIYSRADSTKDFMGLTTFAGTNPQLKDAIIAKNYLTKDELFVMNRLVSAFFDLAEIQATKQIPMYMRDWIAELDKFAISYGKGVLQGAGNISHEDAEQKATHEYKKFQAKTLTPIEQEYLNSLKVIETKINKKKIK